MEKDTFFERRRMLCDFHIPGWVDDINMDCKDYVSRAKAANVQRIEIMSKPHFGNSFYDTATGWKAKGIKQDLLEEIIPLCREAGIKIDAYYNVWHNNIAGKEHPEWLQIKEDGVPVDDRHIMDEMCLNTPYRDHVIVQLVEMASNYDLDGFWLDQITVSHRGCFCESCKEKYRKLYGRELKPASRQTVDERFEFQDFRRKTVNDFVVDATTAVIAVRPGMDFFWNNSGTPLAEQSNRSITKLAKLSSCEMHHPHIIHGIKACRYMRNLGRPFELMMPEGLDSWGDYSINTEKTLGGMVSVIASHGGSSNISAVPSPNGVWSGRVYPGTFETIGNIFGRIRDMEDYLDGATPVRDVVVLTSEKELMARSVMGNIAGNPCCAENNLLGMAEVLIRNHIQFDIVNTDFPDAEDIVGKARLLILPDMSNLDEKWVELIKERVSGGAALIATCRTGLFTKLEQNDNFLLADMLGVDFESFSPYSHIYLDKKKPELFEGIPEAPLLVKGQFNVGSIEPKEYSCYVKARPGVEILANYIEPIIEYDPSNINAMIYMHGHPFKTTDIPAVTLNKYGKGQCIYMGIPAGVAMRWTKSPWLEKMLVNAAKLIHRPVLEAKAPSMVEVNLMEQENRYILHLISLPVKMGKSFIEDDITLTDIEIKLNLPEPRSIEGKNVEFKWETDGSGVTAIKVSKLKDHAMLILNKTVR